MRRYPRRFGRFLDQSFERFRGVSAPPDDPSWERILERLGEEPEAVSDSAHPAMVPVRRTRRWQWPAVAAAVAAVVLAVILPTPFLQGAPAVLEDAEGKRSIQYGELVRPVGDMSAMLSMTDGPRVETQAMSEFSLERTDDGTRIRLKEGGLIVDASAENRANLYVQTKDITALVSGAVSLVKAEEEGSRIASIGGEIRVQQGTTEKKLRAGEQVATSPGMELVPMKEEVAWSRESAAHVAMLAQSAPTPQAAQAPGTVAARPKFAAASVRAVPSGGGPDPIRCLGVDGLLGWQGPPAAQGRCIGRSTFLYDLVYIAYSDAFLDMLYDTKIVGRSGSFPPRGSPERLIIQINAVAENPERVTKGELKLMLQSLLEDRFKARVHLETRELDGYVLTVAPSGIKFKETPSDQQLSGMMNNGCGALNGRYPAGWTGKCRMGTLAAQFARLLEGLPVVDKTGLKGVYDIKLALNEIVTGDGAIPPRGAGGGTYQPVQLSPPLPKAVEEQLGLRLERGKVPVEYVVIDHIEAPTEN